MNYIFLITIAFSLILCDEYYIVVSGDNLTKIANKFGTTVEQLWNWNNIKNPDYIQIGQKLIVSSSTPSTPETPKTEKIVTDEQMKKMGWTNYNLDDLNYCLNKFKINTSIRIRHFISQCSAESNLGKYTLELGGESYCSNYDGRTDLGNNQSGDGCRFKGAGYIQLLGRNIYQKFTNSMGDNKIMEGASYVSQKYPWSAAGFWWYYNGINNLCDRGATADEVMKRINGGLIGIQQYQDVRKYDKLACQIF